LSRAVGGLKNLVSGGSEPGDEHEAAEERAVGDVVDKLRHALTDVPRDHFDALEDELRKKLAPIELPA
jgi:hypothetical protein